MIVQDVKPDEKRPGIVVLVVVNAGLKDRYEIYSN